MFGTILISIIALGVIVFWHELGHFLCARAFRIKVERFSIGFGPRLFVFERGGTEYSLSLILLGGYVKMKGEHPGEGVTGDPDEFLSRPWWQRSLVALAGPFFNLVLAFALFAVAFLIGFEQSDYRPVVGRVPENLKTYLSPGDRVLSINSVKVRGWDDIPMNISETKENRLSLVRNGRSMEVNMPRMEQRLFYKEVLPELPAVVGTIIPGYPAYNAGLLVGDRILTVDNVPIGDWYDMQKAISTHKARRVPILIGRGADTLRIAIDLQEDPYTEGQKKIGIMAQTVPVAYRVRYGPVESVKMGALSTVRMFQLTCDGLVKLFSKPSALKDHIGSVVMVVPMTRQVSQEGTSAILSLFASISLLLVIMNLLPIPVLDGGLILFSIIEGIIRKPIPISFQARLQQIGFFLLMGLMLFAVFNDLLKITNRNVSLGRQEKQIEATTK